MNLMKVVNFDSLRLNRKCGARRVILISELHEWLQNLPSPAASMRHG